MLLCSELPLISAGLDSAKEIFSSREQAEQGLTLANQAGSVIVEIQEGAKQVVGAVGRFTEELL